MEAKIAMQGRRTPRWMEAAAALGLLAGGAVGNGQTSSTAASPMLTLTQKLQSMAARAAVVFSGQVVSIERLGSVVEVTFRVEQTVLGAPGATYTLREWAGLWPPGQFRYTVGQRALLFAHAPSASGLNSPVDGADGAVPLLVRGADAPALLDIRRLEASLPRTPGTPLSTEAEGAIQLSEAVAIVHPAASGAPHAPVRLPLPGGGAGAGAPLFPVPFAPAAPSTPSAPLRNQPAHAPVPSGVRSPRLIDVPVREGGAG